MKISDLLRPPDYTPYVELPKPPEGWPARDSPQALLKSANLAHDNLRHVVRENDRLRAALLSLNKRQEWQLRIFIALTGLTWSLCLGLLKWLVPYAIQGMAH